MCGGGIVLIGSFQKAEEGGCTQHIWVILTSLENESQDESTESLRSRESAPMSENFCILLPVLHAYILEKDSASIFLIRKPRENDSGGLDEVVGDNFERECIEESYKIEE